MDLKSLIRPQLWDEISNTYIAANYRTSILDAMRYLTQIIREKSGLDSDGIPLVGQAFGGEEPKLRLNKLQTQSEKDEQKGFQLIVSGLYTGIRNPRTHEGIQDSKNTADPIIYFINYVLSVVDVAKPPFTTESFLRRVFDEDFVHSQAYTVELVKEIPKNKYLETLIEIYRHKADGDGKTLELIFNELIPNIKEDELIEFLAIVSKELDTINDESIIPVILRIFPKGSWQRLKLTARMRIENKLIKSIQSGSLGINKDYPSSGQLGTWARRIMDEFTMRDELRLALVDSLSAEDIGRKKYVIKYFIDYLPLILTDYYAYYWAVNGIKTLITAGDADTRSKLGKFAEDCPENLLKALTKGFRDWTDNEKPEFFLKDGSPFLGNIPLHIQAQFEDDIPF